MHIKRMTRLVKTLEGLTKDERRRFDMSEWSQQKECGTVCCAVGWYCVKNPRSGLVLGHEACPYLRTNPRANAWSAIRLYFGLSPYKADYLFLGEKYEHPTYRNVLNRIKKAVAKATKEKA